MSNKKIDTHKIPIQKDVALQTNLKPSSKKDLIIRSNSKLYTFYDYLPNKNKNVIITEKTSTGTNTIEPEESSASENETDEPIVKYIQVRKNSVNTFKPRRSYSLRNNIIYPELNDVRYEQSEDYYEIEPNKQQIYYLYEDIPISKEKVVYVEKSAPPQVPIVAQVSKPILYQPQPVQKQVFYPTQVAVSNRLPYNTIVPPIAPVQPLKIINAPIQVPIHRNYPNIFRRHSYAYK